MRTLKARLLFTLFLVGNSAVAHAQGSARPAGAAVLERMRSAYAGKWYPTLTFVQETRMHRADSTVVQRWLESVRYTPEKGGQLRIDAGDLALGNGTLYTFDSTWVVRNGRLAGNPRPRGNEFIPLIESVYLQPVERTMRELEPMHVDLTRVRSGEWNGRKVTIVGASSPSDTTSPQFWVDDQTNVVLRMLIAAGGNQVMDVHIGGYKPAGKGLLGTDVKMYIGGKLIQEELYTEWKTDMPLNDALFDPAQWMTAPHWGRK